MSRQKLGLPVEPKGFGQNEGMKMEKSVHPASRKPEKAAWAKMTIQDLDLFQRDSENPRWFPEEREGKFWGTTVAPVQSSCT